MKETTLYGGREGFAVLGLAVSLGVLARLLLFQTEWGLGATIWFLAFAVTLIGFATDWSPRVPRDRLWVAVPLLILPLANVWRASETLLLANIAAIMTLSGVWVGSMLLERSQSTQFIRVLAKLTWLFPQFVGAHCNAKRTGILDESDAWRSALRGAVFAVPFLVLFGALLADADDRFAAFLVIPAKIDLDRWVPTVVQILFTTAVAGTFLLGTTRFLRGQQLVSPRPPRLTVNAVEALVVIGLVSLLFASFLVVRLYGTTLDGLTNAALSSNAREGFFQLVAVSAISLGLVTALSRRLRDPGDSKAETALHPFFGRLVALNGALVLGILASAALGMYAYTSALGWTVLRVNVTFAMIWTAVLFGALIFKHLSDARFELSRVGIVTALVLLVGMHALNPDGFIAARNLERGNLSPGDVELLTHLSPDALPAITTRFDELDAETQEVIRQSWATRLNSGARDWRSWSVAEARLRRAVSR